MMSKAKKTKRTKKYSQVHLYRHFTEISNHIKKLDKPKVPSNSIRVKK